MQNFKIQSGLKKIISISKHGIEPYEIGKYNFENPNKETESLAKERLAVCLKCPMFVEEPIEFLRVVDPINQISNKMCDECGCSLSYKLRQSKSICDKWQK